MRIIALDGPALPMLDPDVVWNGIVGDLEITPADAPINPAGLRAGQSLATAVLICLMTDCRVEATELRDGQANRGWPGDSFDLEPGEVALGSRLWLLRCRALAPDIELEAQDYARAALQPLIDDGAFARFDVTASVNRPQNRLDLDVRGYGNAGEQRFSQRFALLWGALARDPLTPAAG
ncbi:MAG TPA: phage GP46 family protein [Mesorhizobium sp.]|jgi:phage gp46-like protein|uniref:phage GP46 family protein n=1 Tax=Mesorhizobium sp. TaxID=1871066 RepID=UPI002DDD933C|nr:phage GP46 family protein [Mesorhizobium sp.]HEV2501485.1 phage GP46 family protein [Mesorhizobium sp.]